MENRKKVLIVFVIFIAALAAFIFYDPSPDAEQADSEVSSDAVISEQDDTASKKAWYYSSDTQNTLYAEFWISGNSKYSYHTWESSKDSQSDVKEKEITGKCKKQESRLFYCVDGKKQEGVFPG